MFLKNKDKSAFHEVHIENNHSRSQNMQMISCECFTYLFCTIRDHLFNKNLGLSPNYIFLSFFADQLLQFNKTNHGHYDNLSKKPYIRLKIIENVDKSCGYFLKRQILRGKKLSDNKHCVLRQKNLNLVYTIRHLFVFTMSSKQKILSKSKTTIGKAEFN